MKRMSFSVGNPIVEAYFVASEEQAQIFESLCKEERLLRVFSRVRIVVIVKTSKSNLSPASGVD
jgi:hypothetical protein